MYGQINQMWTKIKPKACTYSRVLAPSVTHCGPITIHSALEMHDTTKSAFLKNIFECEHLAVPTSILKDG